MSASQNTKLQLIQTSRGQRIAYRRLGPSTGIPLVMHIHFRGNMDFWDPLFLNALAARRPVITFDPSGVGRSTGPVADTFQGWADNVIAFVQALGLTQIDLLGFSMGGAAVQMVALTAPKLIRKLILAGTTASVPNVGSDLTGIVWPRDMPPKRPFVLLNTASTPQETKECLAYSFFYDDSEGRAAFDAYWARLLEGSIDGSPRNLQLLGQEGTKRQRESMVDWSHPNPRNSYDRLHELKMPVLVANGDNDVLIPTSRSLELFKRIQNAQLIVYPRAGHGFLHQYAEAFAADVNAFLDAETLIRSKL